jgi:hypothetical protein
MQITSTLPLKITVTHYLPGDPGQTSGRPDLRYPPEPTELEFEIHTLSGHALTESDFGKACWKELYDLVLATHEAELEERYTEAQIEAWEAAHE